MNDVSQGITGLKQAGALDGDDRPSTAEQQSCGYRDGFAFPTNANQVQL
jgi:hypothetical protein